MDYLINELQSKIFSSEIDHLSEYCMKGSKAISLQVFSTN